MDGLCLIGVITGVHGIHGAVTALSHSDDPARFRKLTTVLLGPTPDITRRYHLKSAQEHKKRIVLMFEEVSDRTQAELLKGLNLYVTDEDMAELPQGRYYIHDLLGCQIVTTDGELKGSVCDVLLLPANDVYVVDCAGREVLIPAVPSVIEAVDIEEKRITVIPLPGLFEDEHED